MAHGTSLYNQLQKKKDGWHFTAWDQNISNTADFLAHFSELVLTVQLPASFCESYKRVSDAKLVEEARLAPKPNEVGRVDTLLGVIDTNGAVIDTKIVAIMKTNKQYRHQEL